MQVSTDLLIDIQFIDDDRVYEVVCTNGNNSRKYKLEIFAENYPAFKDMLDEYLEDEPNVRVHSIRAMTPDEYRTVRW